MSNISNPKLGQWERERY